MSGKQDRSRSGQARAGGTGRAGVAAPRPTQSRGGILLAGGVVGLVLLLVVGGVLYQRSQSTPVGAGYGGVRTAAVSVQDGVVRLGDTDAPLTLDVYEDFLCPVCGQFEELYGQQLAQGLDEGTVSVRYHLLDFLGARSASGDYSSRAAGAALCVAEDGPSGVAFAAFHTALFDEDTQPREGADADLTDDQLAELAAAAGASEQAQQCVAGSERTAAAVSASAAGQAELEAGGFRVATPTVLDGSSQVDTSDRDWLTNLS